MIGSPEREKGPDWIGLRFDPQAWREIWRRFSFLLLIAASALLLLLAKADIRLIEFASTRLQMVAWPFIGFVQHPVSTLRQGIDFVGELISVHEYNQRLKADNLELRSWKARAVHLDVQNRSLRDQLSFPKTENTPAWITARVIADSTTSFVHTRLLALGADAGLEQGMAIVDENGLAGRLIDVGAKTSRLLLITDFSSKIPVMIASSNDRAILTGDNGPQPVLDFLPLDPSYRIGDVVLTSGHGGVLPPGIPVGVISATIDNQALVRPFADWSRLDFATALIFRPLPTPDEAGISIITIKGEPDQDAAKRDGPT